MGCHASKPSSSAVIVQQPPDAAQCKKNINKKEYDLLLPSADLLDNDESSNGVVHDEDDAMNSADSASFSVTTPTSTTTPEDPEEQAAEQPLADSTGDHKSTEDNQEDGDGSQEASGHDFDDLRANGGDYTIDKMLEEDIEDPIPRYLFGDDADEDAGDENDVNINFDELSPLKTPRKQKRNKRRSRRSRKNKQQMDDEEETEDPHVPLLSSTSYQMSPISMMEQDPNLVPEKGGRRSSATSISMSGCLNCSASTSPARQTVLPQVVEHHLDESYDFGDAVYPGAASVILNDLSQPRHPKQEQPTSHTAAVVEGTPARRNKRGTKILLSSPSPSGRKRINLNSIMISPQTPSDRSTATTVASTPSSIHRSQSMDSSSQTNMTIPEEFEEEDCPTHGLRLSFLLNEFVQFCGGMEALKGLSTFEVCEHIIKPQTFENQSSYCDMFKSNHQVDARVVGETADVFICHVHQYQFLDVLEALKYHFTIQNQEPHIIVWLDIFSMNQHHQQQDLPPSPARAVENGDCSSSWMAASQPSTQTYVDSSEWLSTKYKSVIQGIGRTVLVLGKTAKESNRFIIPFTRSWCLFEMYCASTNVDDFEIAFLNADDLTNFIDDLVQHQPSGDGDSNRNHSGVNETHVAVVDQMLATIRAEKSQCYKDEDRVSIFTYIENAVGFAKINSIVFDLFRDWVIKIALDALSTSCSRINNRILDYKVEAETDQQRQDEIRRCGLLKVIGTIYCGKEEYSQAESYLRCCYVESKLVFGNVHPYTLKSMRQYASVYLELNDYTKARTLLGECLKLCSQSLGDNHEITMILLNDVALVYKLLGNHDTALSLYQECLEQRTAVLGEHHRDTLTSMNNLASLHEARGEFDTALPIFQSCFLKQIFILGESHPCTLTTMNGMAAFYKNRGEFDKALPYFERCLELRLQVLGPIHPDTVSSMNNLASFFYAQDLDKMAKEQQAIYDEQVTTLGEFHPTTLSSLKKMAEIYKTQGEQGKALSLYKECLDKRIETFGRTNPETLSSMNTLAKFYSLQLCQYDMAQPLYEECLSTRTVVLGLDHPDTLESIQSMAVLYEKQGDFRKAHVLYEECLESRTKIFGKSHPDTLAAMANLSLCFQAEARLLAKECANQSFNHYGKDHPVSQSLQRRLTSVLACESPSPDELMSGTIKLKNQEMEISNCRSNAVVDQQGILKPGQEGRAIELYCASISRTL